MPSQHAPDKTCVATWIPRTLARRLAKRAKERGYKHLSSFIEDLFTHETRQVELTSEDYQQIARETEQARKRIDRRSRAARASSQAEKGGGR